MGDNRLPSRNGAFSGGPNFNVTFPEDEELSGLNALWSDAVKRCSHEYHIPEEELVANGAFGSATSGVERASQLFENMRHPIPDGQKQKVVNAIGGCLDWVDKAAGLLSDNVGGTVCSCLKYWAERYLLIIFCCSMQHLLK